MTTVEHLVEPAGLAPTGGRYSQAVKVGDWLFIAGQTALDASGNVVGMNDATAQTRQVYQNLAAAVRAAGGTPANIVKTVTYIIHRDHVQAVRAAREELAPALFGNKPPTSTLLVISGLARPEFLVEIDAVAYLGS